MDKSKINQTELDFSMGLGASKVNLYTGRLLYECPGLNLGANTFKIGSSLIYNSLYKNTDFGGKKIGIGNGWKLSIQQYVFPYNSSYDLPDFEDDDYIYIDSNWSIHRFVKYKETVGYADTRNVYYDASGSGLRLITGVNRYSEIYDGNNSTIKFDLNGRLTDIISSVNADISKKIVYTNDNLTAIYDTRKSDRQINFEYSSDGKLLKIKSENYKVSLALDYSENNQLAKVVKHNKTQYKDMVYFNYNSANMLNYVVDAENLRTMNFEYTSNKVSIVKDGTMKKQFITSNTKPEVYVGEGEYIGDNYFLVSNSKKLESIKLVLIDSFVKTITSFDYMRNCTDVISDKNIKTRYYYNVKNFTSTILEVDEKDIYNHKTLFKTGGWQLSSNGSTIYKINNNRAHQMSKNNEGKYTFSTTLLNSFKDIFKKNSNGSEKKNEYTENFVVSFWVKSSVDINNTITATTKIYKNSSLHCSESTYLDKTYADAWQYVTIPVNLGDNQETISQVNIVLTGATGTETFYLTDLRIAIGNNTNTIIGNNENIELKNLTKVVFNDLETQEASGDFFLTDGDLFATFKSLYYMKQKGQTTYDFVYCSGTKVKSIRKATVYAGSSSVILDVDSSGIPNYHTYSLNKTGDEQWSLTETQVRFHKESDTKFYYETKVAIEMINEKRYTTYESKSTKIYEWQNANGTMRAKKDEYGVVTAYYYDSYGNPIKTAIYNDYESEDSRETIETIYDYGTITERMREYAKSCTQNGVTEEIVYNEPQFTTNYSLLEDSKTMFEYDDYDEKIKSISNKNRLDGTNEIIKNTLLYDEYGRIKSISDKRNRTYGIIYNAFGEPLKYFENGKLILEKQVEKNSNYDLLVDKIYNNQTVIDNQVVNIPYENITKIDNYGRISSQINKKKSTDIGDEIKFTYQEIEESNSVSKVKIIEDPYENIDYDYIYDDDNRPAGYTMKKSDGSKKMEVRQIGTGDTQYYFDGSNEYIVSKVIKEDSEVEENGIARFHNPRIKRTKYEKMTGREVEYSEDENTFDEFNFEYGYDALGRLSSKINIPIEHSGPYLNNKVNVEKYINYENGKTTVSKIEYITNTKDGYKDQSASLIFDNEYDSRNNLKKMSSSGDRFIHNPSEEDYEGKVNYIPREHNYTYDIFNRLTNETRKENSVVVSNIEYDYSQESDKLRKVKRNGVVHKTFTYDKGRKIKMTIDASEYTIEYDNYGNIIKDVNGSITYNSRNLLNSYYIGTNSNNYYNTSEYLKKCDYFYNYQGVRYQKRIKETNTKYVKYYVDGSRILGEDWSYSDNTSGKSIKYLYDAEGITGLRYDGCNFNFIKDSLGNVSKVMYRGKVIGEYVYDAWGNHEVIELSIDSDATDGARDRFVLYNNPFRWKSHYLDLETGLYFVNGRYYSPILMEYLDAANIEDIKLSTDNLLDRHTITLDNSITYEENTDSIFTDTELYPDPTYDPISKKSWWSLNWKKAIQWIAFAVVFIVSIVLMCIPATSAFGVGMFMAGLKAAISGAIIGGIIGGIMSAISGNSFMEGLVEGAVYGFINGFTTGALMFCASQAVTALSKAASGRCKAPGQCFVAGTVVLTSIGNKKIEDIEVGDEVWAYDEETGEKSLKKVVDLLRNTTKKWIHLLFEFNDGSTEQITCTDGHPFYVNNIGWVTADKLLANDEILMYNNDTARLVSKNIEILEKEETTYNFEVEDFHTYYVGENEILVHNDCRREAVRKAWKLEQQNVKNGGDGISRKWTTAQKKELLRRGKVRGFDGHHMKSVKGYADLAGDPNNIQFLTRSEHFAAHSGNWRNVTHGKYIIGG